MPPIRKVEGTYFAASEEELENLRQREDLVPYEAEIATGPGLKDTVFLNIFVDRSAGATGSSREHMSRRLEIATKAAKFVMPEGSEVAVIRQMQGEVIDS